MCGGYYYSLSMVLVCSASSVLLKEFEPCWNAMSLKTRWDFKSALIVFFMVMVKTVLCCVGSDTDMHVKPSFTMTSVANLDHQTHSHLSNHHWNLTSSSYPIDCVCVHAQAEVCFDCVLVLCLIMGYVLQFGEIAHKLKEYIIIINVIIIRWFVCLKLAVAHSLMFMWCGTVSATFPSEFGSRVTDHSCPDGGEIPPLQCKLHPLSFSTVS